MNTPAHLLIGAALMGRRRAASDAASGAGLGAGRGLIWAAMAGGLAPDLSLYLLAGGAIYLLGIPPRVVFDELYFSDAWQMVFAVDNSFILWGILAGLAVWRRAPLAIAFAGAGLIHLCLDFPLHHDDGRPHFWPLSDWIYASPVSYWDRAHGAAIIGPIEGALSALAAVRLWLWRPGWAISAVVAVILLAELSVTWVWVFVFMS